MTAGVITGEEKAVGTVGKKVIWHVTWRQACRPDWEIAEWGQRKKGCVRNGGFE